MIDIRKCSTAFVALLAVTLAGAVTGQEIDTSKALEATVLGVDMHDRTVTVKFDEGDVQRTYPVADDAEFFTFDGKLAHPQKFTDLHEGSKVMLEFGNINGEVTLNKVTTEMQHGSG